MGRRARIAVALGAAGVLVAAVLALRSGTADDLDALLDSGAPPVVVDEFATGIVTLPDPGPPPDPPGAILMRAGPDRLQVIWGPGVPGGATAAGAAGYQVRWAERGGGPDREMVVAGPGVELTGLRPGGTYRVQVRSVDAVGRRSLPVFGFATLDGEPDTGWQQRYAFLDGFDAATPTSLPDSRRWRFASGGEFCLRAGSGSGAEAGRLVLQLDCGATLHTLIPTVPLRLAPGPGGELGRVAVVTDAAGAGGLLSIDLVPGPADGVGPSLGPPRPGVDPALPPGTLRVVIGADAAAVIAGPQVPRSGVAPEPDAKPAVQAAGVAHRFEVVLRTDGVVVLRDGLPVAAADVLAPWPQASVLLGVTGPPGGSARIRVDAVGISAAGSAPPITPRRDAVSPPRLVLPGTPPEGSGVAVRDAAVSAQLRALLHPESAEPLGEITAVLGGVAVPVAPAVPGTTPRPGALYPVVAQLPVPARAPGSRLGTPRLPPVRLVAPQSPGTEVVSSSVLFGYPPGTAVGSESLTAPPAPPSTRRLAPAVAAQPLDAAGQVPEPARPLPRGRMVLDVQLHGEPANLAGLAGIELWLDGERIATVPTARGVPAVGGRHRFGIRTAALAPGPHAVVVRAIPAEPGVEPRRAEITVQLR